MRLGEKKKYFAVLTVPPRKLPRLSLSTTRIPLRAGWLKKGVRQTGFRHCSLSLSNVHSHLTYCILYTYIIRNENTDGFSYIYTHAHTHAAGFPCGNSFFLLSTLFVFTIITRRRFFFYTFPRNSRIMFFSSF